MKYLTSFILITALYLPTLVYGDTYKPLVGIPGVDPNANFSGYINSLYVLSISIAALLAVIKIVIAGVKWMLTDVVTSKGEAKKDIYGAVIGLLVVLAAVLVLTVINPNLTNVVITFDKVNSISSPNTGMASEPLVPVENISLGGSAKVEALPKTAGQQQRANFIQSCPNRTSPTHNPQSILADLSTHYHCIRNANTEVVTRYVSNETCAIIAKGKDHTYAKVSGIDYCRYVK